MSEENEDIVKWALAQFPCLSSILPFSFPGSAVHEELHTIRCGFPTSDNDFNQDTIGFFIAAFEKS